MVYSLITIGITAYNAENTLEKAVLSAIRQDWENTDIVIVDDYSIDKTAEILRRLSKQYTALRIFQQSRNSGVATVRNRIIEEAKGDFIAFFDDDDESAPERLMCQYQRITTYEQAFANGAPVICHTARTQVYPDVERRYESTMGTDESGLAPHGEAVAKRILMGKPIKNVFGSTATCSQMARTSVYRDLDKFDEKFHRSEDTDFNIRAALAGAHFVGIKKPLVTQTMTLAADKKLDEERACALQLLEKHKTFIDRKSSYSFCCRWIEAKYDFLAGDKKYFLLKMLKLFVSYPIETLKRFFWALPNIGFNVKLNRFHNEQK